MRRLYIPLCLAIGGSTACGHAPDGLTAPAVPTTPFSILSGANVSDTVSAKLTAPLFVLVRTSTGAPLAGVTVRFDAIPTPDQTRKSESAIAVAPRSTEVFGASTTDVTDAQGRASILVQLGTIAGAARIAATAADGKTDTASFTVRTGTPVSLSLAVRDTTLYLNESFPLGAFLRDRYGNAATQLPTATLTSLGGSAPTLSADGVVRAGATIGRARIAVQGLGKNDSIMVNVVPAATIVGSDNDALGLRVAGLNGKLVRILLSLLNDKHMFSSFPVWSGDGSHMVVTGEDIAQTSGLFLFDSLGKYTTLVPAAYPTPYHGAQFSKDGVWVYYAQTNDYNVTQPTQLYRIHPDGTGKELLYSSTAADGAWRAPSPSSNGAFVIVSGADYVTGPNGLPVGTPKTGRLDLSTMKITQFPTGGAASVYSPAADRVAMIADDGRLLTSKPDGSDVRVITSSLISATTFGPLTQPSWSPDGSYIIAQSNSVGRWVVVRASDGVIVPTALPSRLQSVSWRP